MNGPDLNNGLGASVKMLRKMRGLSQAELAQRVGINRTSITNIEAGTQMLTVKTINGIAAALGYEVRLTFVLRTPTDGGTTNG